MAKSQINQLSKRQILESLMYEQNQSSSTLSRLITAVARTANVDPEKLADMFIDDQGNQEYINKFNASVKTKHAHKVTEQQSSTTSASDNQNSSSENTETPSTETDAK